MSCKHGNWEPCDECQAEDALYKDGYEAGKKAGWEACETCHDIVDGKHQRAERQQDELTRLRAENEALRADAERYRWIRSDEGGGSAKEYKLTYEQLDAAIDAARKAQS